MHARAKSGAGSRWAAAVGIGLVLGGCGPRLPQTPGAFGEVTSAIVVVNPVINQGSTTTVVPGTVRADVLIEVDGGPAAETDADGLALLQPLPVGTLTVGFPPGDLSLPVAAEKELYDLVVAVRGDAVEYIVPPIRYPIGGTFTVVEPGESITDAAAQDGAILLLAAGTFTEDVELRSAGVLIFGAWDPIEGPLSSIDGNLSVVGGNNRIRGVSLTGTLTSAANGLSVAFSDLASASITGNGVTLIRNRFTGAASVPSASAVLVDNTGLQ